jgi:hypothetical protein
MSTPTLCNLPFFQLDDVSLLRELQCSEEDTISRLKNSSLRDLLLDMSSDEILKMFLSDYYTIDKFNSSFGIKVFTNLLNYHYFMSILDV